MYLMYVDESGDTGMVNSPSPYFVLAGLVVHELHWRNFIEDMLSIRKALKAKYKIGLRDEIHSAVLLQKPLYNLPKHQRLQLLRDYTKAISQISYISVTSVLVNKEGKDSSSDIFDIAWTTLFQRFENTLHAKNFPGSSYPDDKGLIFCDDTDGRKLNRIIRRMAVYNPIASRYGNGYANKPIRFLVEDPIMRNSKDSLAIQAADLCAFWLYQSFKPNNYIKKKTGTGYFRYLEPILNIKACPKHPLGVVVR